MDLIARKGKLFVAVLWLFLVTAAQVGGEESARIALVSQKSFDDTVQHLDWQLGGYGITILSRVDFGSLAETVGVSKKGSLILEVMRRSWLKTVFEQEPAAALELPLRIYVHERENGETTVSYYRPSGQFGRYALEALTTLGGELDVTLERVVSAAIR